MDVVVNDEYMAIWPIAAGVLLVCLVLLWRRKPSLWYVLCCAAFGIYVLMALQPVLFPIFISGSIAAEMREGRQWASFLNLVPFNFNLSEMPELVFRQMFQNVLLTMPFGFGVSFVASIRGRRILWVALAVGLGIEGLQVLIALLVGYPHRVLDINDVMLNGLGVLIGYGVFRVFAPLYVWVIGRSGLTPRGLFAYMYGVAAHQPTESNPSA